LRWVQFTGAPACGIMQEGGHSGDSEKFGGNDRAREGGGREKGGGWKKKKVVASPEKTPAKNRSGGNPELEMTWGEEYREGEKGVESQGHQMGGPSLAS